MKICPKCGKWYGDSYNGYCSKCCMKPIQMNEYDSSNAKNKKQKNLPKCPTCQSNNVRKISTTKKVGGIALFGIFSKSAFSQFKCNDCGYKW